MVFDIENWHWKLKIHQFEVPGIMSLHKIQQSPWRPFILKKSSPLILYMQVRNLELVFKELYHLAAILQHYVESLIFVK